MTDNNFHNETSQTNEAGVKLASASDNLSVAKAYAVATAFHEGIMSYDATAKDGKGGFKGGKALYQALCDGAEAVGLTVPDEMEGQISKIARVLVDYGRHLLDLGHAQTRWDGCAEFVRQHKDLAAMYNKVYAKDKGPASLSQMVANLLAWSAKNGHENADVLAEMIAQCEAQVSE
jgi:hypothetical protein